ncbi:MAG: glycerate kinase [Gammaproteobacteria bacterium]|nr:glycerate kinase [Gammaproteobacteria bacterium]
MTGATGTWSPESLLRTLFDAAVDAARAENCVPEFLPQPPAGRTVVVGAGKAAAAMALALEQHWSGDLSGAVVTAHGHGVPCRRIEVLEASHPLPAGAGVRAAERMLELVSGLTPQDLVIALISGGGSSLMPLPATGLALEEKQAMTRALLACGATISEINCVRRHLSRIKGGRLGAACHPARVVTLAISDVPGDSPADIASGPTVADPTTCGEALAALERYGIGIPPLVRAKLETGAWESVKPRDTRLARSEFQVIAAPLQSLEAAARAAAAHGVEPLILSDRVEGEARIVGREMAALAARVVQGGHRVRPPCVLLSGGETTVTVRGRGCGGRNVEFLLALGLALPGRCNVHALACDTDGVDGMAAVAGAVWRPDSPVRAKALGLDPNRFLHDNDAHAFFALLGDQVVTGPTRTNVNDFRAILVLPEDGHWA